VVKHALSDKISIKRIESQELGNRCFREESRTSVKTSLEELTRS
jgi:hypothetical protein